MLIRDFIEIGSVVLFRNRVDLEGMLHETTGYETMSRPIVFGIVAKSSQQAELTILTNMVTFFGIMCL